MYITIINFCAVIIKEQTLLVSLPSMYEKVSILSMNVISYCQIHAWGRISVQSPPGSSMLWLLPLLLRMGDNGSP